MYNVYCVFILQELDMVGVGVTFFKTSQACVEVKSRNLPALFFRLKRAGDNKSIVLSMFNIVVFYFNI